MTTAHSLTLPAALKLVQEYDAADGISPDAYHATPQWHAMAEGRYLTALAALRPVLSAGEYAERLARSEARLLAGHVSTDPRRLCWGLGFPYKTLAARAPTLVTTVIVAHGLLEHLDSVSIGLVAKTAAWLDDPPWRLETTHGWVPAYAEGLDTPILNAIALWVGALARCRRAGILPVRTTVADMDRIGHWVCHHELHGVGWPYAPEDWRVDLVHQCFVLEGLGHWTTQVAMGSVEQALSAFRWEGDWIDRFTVEACPRGEHRLHRQPTPPLLWGYGALLLAASLGCPDSLRDTITATAETCADRALRVDSPGTVPLVPFARHRMHLAAGLAAWARASAASQEPPCPS